MPSKVSRSSVAASGHRRYNTGLLVCAAAATASIVTPPGPFAASNCSTACRIAASSSSPRRRRIHIPFGETLAYLKVRESRVANKKRSRILEDPMTRPVLYPLRPVETAMVRFTLRSTIADG